MIGRNHERGEGCALYIGTFVRRIFVLGYQCPFSSIHQWYIVEYHYIIKMHVFGVPTYFIQNANRDDLYLLLISEAASVDK